MHRNREALSILSKIDQFIVLILIKWRPSWILLAVKYLEVRSTPLCQTCFETLWYTPNYDFASILYKMMPIYCFTLHKWLQS